MVSPDQERYALFPLFLAGVLLVVLAPVFWLHTGTEIGKPSARAHDSADVFAQAYPDLAYGFGRIRAGALPRWSPNQLCGTPFLPEPRHGTFQILNLPFWFLNTEAAMALQAFLVLFLMGAGMLLYASALDVRVGPALIGSLCYAFGGVATTALGRPELCAPLTVLPFLFWILREYARHGGYPRWLLGVALSASLLLGGSMPCTAAVLVLLVPYAVIRGIIGDPERRNQTGGACLRGIAVMGVLAALIAAAQWVPTFVWLQTLAHPWETLWRVDWPVSAGLRWRELAAQFLTPPNDALPHLLYFGMAPLLLLPGAWFHRPARMEALFFTIAVLILTPFAMGSAIFGGAFAPDALLVPMSFAFAVLAALGAERIFGVGRDPRSPLIWIPALITLAIAAGLLYLGGSSARGRILLVIAPMLVFFLARQRWIGVTAAVLTALLLFVDLYAVHPNRAQRAFREARSAFDTRARLYKAAEEQSLGDRVLVLSHTNVSGLPDRLGLLTPLRCAGGADLPLTPEQYTWWRVLAAESDPDAVGATLDPGRRGIRPALLNLMSVRALLAANDVSIPVDDWEKLGVRLRNVRIENGVTLYLNDSALPRCRWTPQARIVDSTDAAVSALLDPNLDPAKTAVVQGEAAAVAALHAIVPEENAPAPTVAQNCRIVAETPEQVTVQVDGAQPGLVVLADSFDEDWIATRNGERAPILRANGCFRAVAVPAGNQTVVFSYRPTAVYAGIGIGGAGLALTLLTAPLAAVRAIKRRQTRER
jgi:hypothetical protein